MKKIKTYFFLQLKMVIKSIPVILLGTLVLGVILVIGVMAADSMMSKGEERTAGIEIAIVINDDNKYTNMAISMLMEEENIKKICSFKEMTEVEAARVLKNGEVSATVVIPENFLAGILNGTNIPARIIVPDGNGYSQSLIFRELINAGASDLATAQSAIYAVDDLCIAAGIDAIQESEDYLNKKLLLYALSRNKYYDLQEISKTGNLSVLEFYIASGMVMFLLFGGVICGDLIGRDNSVFSTCISRNGIRKWMAVVFKLVSVSLIYFFMLTAVYGISVMMGLIQGNLISILAIAVVVLAVFSMNLFVFQIADNRITGAIILFMGTIIMMFLAGNIIPEAFLPEMVNSIGRFMPSKWLVQLVGQVLTGEILWSNMLIGIVTGLVFTGLTICIKCVEEKGGYR